MASIKKEKNGTYTVQVSVGKNPETGKYSTAKRRSIRTKKEATLIAAEIERQVVDGVYWSSTMKQKLTYKAAYEVWFEKFSQNHEPATNKKAKGMFDNHFLPRFGHMDVTDITPLMINNFSIELSKRFVCCDLMFYRFVAPMRLAHKLDMIDQNPAINVDAPRAHESKGLSKSNDFYEETELDLFLQMSEQLSRKKYKQYAFFRLLSMTGMRNQEIRALSWYDLDFDNCTLFIHRAVSVSDDGEYIADRTKNKASTRRISIDDVTMDVIRQWREIHQTENVNWDETWLIFTNNRYDEAGQNFLSTSGIRKWKMKVQDLMDEKSGEKLKRIDVHGFRHTHVSLLLQNGVMPKAVADRVGHTDLTQINRTYAHTTKIADEQLNNTLTTLLPSTKAKKD